MGVQSMAETTKIEWADSTFNGWIGCTRVSAACDHCYAAVSTPARTNGIEWGAGKPRQRTMPATWKLPEKWNRETFYQCADCGWRGLPLVDDDLPITDADGKEYSMISCRACEGCSLTETRRRVFCHSLGDWLDNEVPIEWLVDLLDLIRRTPNLDWLLLTKRIGNWQPRLEAVFQHLIMQNGSAASYLADWVSLWVLGVDMPPHVWIGATVVNQQEADRDVPKLLQVPARVRFLSIEPMLGRIDLAPYFEQYPDKHGVRVVQNNAGIDWIICGGESGPQARPMHPGWVCSLRDQCAAAQVPFLFKQWGEWCPRGPQESGYPIVEHVARFRMTDAGDNGSVLGAKGGNDVWMNRAGRKVTGNLLDGRQHLEFPV
jgi:protein gp37